MNNLYKSKEWGSLNKIDRAQLLLVIEGLKKGTIVRGNHTSFMNILNKTGLDYTLNTNKYRLNPVAVVAKKEDLREANHRYLTLPENAEWDDFDKVTGWLLGYPECCTEEYVADRTPEQIKAERNGQSYLSYNFGKELDSQIKKEGSYSEIFDYRPPSFTPCGIECPEATKTLASWKEAIDTLDPEAGNELVYFNRESSPQMWAHIDYLNQEREKRNLEYKLNFIRKSVK